MSKLKKWFEKCESLYESSHIRFDKVSWFMLFPQIIIFYNYNLGRFEAITFEWLFWSLSFGRWDEV